MAHGQWVLSSVASILYIVKFTNLQVWFVTLLRVSHVQATNEVKMRFPDMPAILHQSCTFELFLVEEES